MKILRMNIREALAQASEQLQEVSTSPILDSEVLLANVLNKNSAYLIAHSDDDLNKTALDIFNNLVAMRRNGKPVAYILQNKEFYGRDFYVDERVLIPRPETELIIDEVLQLAAQENIQKPSVLDIGTGSGCLSVTLALELADAKVTATDISTDALKVAKKNAAGLNANASFYSGDLFDALPAKLKNKFDVIVSNPPYLNLNNINLNDPDSTSLKSEPDQALAPTTHDFDIINQIIEQAPKWLSEHGILLIEIGHDQGEQALAAANKYFATADYSIKKDLAGHDRLLIVKTADIKDQLIATFV